jgi:hypothetical protein
MNNETTNEEVKDNQTAEPDAQLVELVKAVHHNCLVALRMHFDEVEGHVVTQEMYGPVFFYHVKNESNHVYSCGFFLRELVNQFQNGNDPAKWLASFFVELMKKEDGQGLRTPPRNEDEAKFIVDKVLVPHCVTLIREEFAPEPVHVDLALHEKFGPVLEAGFPSIVKGNNVCAFPLHLLITHLLMNRDPSELLIQGLYNIREEHGLQ